MSLNTQTFNDGIANVYKATNIAQPGNKPKDGLVLKVGNLRYEERTVGMSRFWAAKQDNIKVDQLLRMQRINSVSTLDAVVLSDETQYIIKQIQYPKGIEPPCMDLSLERLVTKYDIG